MKTSAIAIAAFIVAGAISNAHAVPVTVDAGDLVAGEDVTTLAPGVRKPKLHKPSGAGDLVGCWSGTDCVGANQASTQAALVHISLGSTGSFQNPTGLRLTMSEARDVSLTKVSQTEHPRDSKHVAAPKKKGTVKVPEPGSLTLFGLALAGLGVAGRRRAK